MSGGLKISKLRVCPNLKSQGSEFYRDTILNRPVFKLLTDSFQLQPYELLEFLNVSS